MTSDKRIFFSSTLFTPFIEEDFLILTRHFRVSKLIAEKLRAFVRIPAEVLRCDLVFAWFGSIYAGYAVFLAKLLGKKSVIVVAGVDASKDPEINYGIWLSPWRSRILRYAFRNADQLLPVDPFLEKEIKRLAEYDGHNISTIAFGFDAIQWTAGEAKNDMVLCVASCDNRDRLKKKGIDKLFDAARMLPEVPFQVIGVHERILTEVKSLAPANVEIISFVPRSQLLPFYQKAKVYCQPSFTEGLPNTLCEAMLCACIPVGTIAGGIPTAIGDAGYLVAYRDQPALVDALKRALASPASHGLKARARMMSEFTLEKRERSLVAVINTLLS
ncbi:MAG: glycosyltransferase family 4 protein [Ignavibacteriae bacterium]|nr:glycosyltransferase family 4 protein [Ignavibacteriota bacterium]